MFGAGLGLFVYYNLIGNFPGLEAGISIVLQAGIFGVAQLWLFYKISNWINKRFPWEKQFSLRIVLDFVINAIVGIITSSFVLYTILAWLNKGSFTEIWSSYRESFLILWIMVIVLVIMYNIIMLLFYAYYHYAEGQISEIKMERKQLKLQFDALRNQLSPHFLFNSLNTIS